MAVSAAVHNIVVRSFNCVVGELNADEGLVSRVKRDFSTPIQQGAEPPVEMTVWII
jgi:hypothetical protein